MISTSPDGAFLGLLGPNGAGKTTLIGAVCNLLRPTAGEIRVFGHDHESRAARRLVGLAEQEINLDRFLNIGEMLVYHAGYHGIGRREAQGRARELLDLFKLGGKAKSRHTELSGGMQRRLLLASSRPCCSSSSSASRSAAGSAACREFLMLSSSCPA
jgi:ABC-2 type transport system ATP-binding protein